MSKKTKSHKKLREKFLFERFAEMAKVSFEIVDETREAPDFIVSIDGKLVGVEITELFVSHERGSKTMQAYESISSRIVISAQELYQHSKMPPAHVTVCFNSGVDLSNLNRDKTAKALSEFVQKLNLSEWQRVDWRSEDMDESLPDDIAFVHALGVPSFDLAHWTVARAGWVAPLSITTLQSCVDKKARRLKDYQKTIAENWLIVVADATKPSQNIQAVNEFNAKSISSPFARTFFYRYPDSKIIEF